MAKSPEKIFKSLDFTSLPEKSLVQLIKRDDLQMKEVEIWEHVLRWGTKNSTLNNKDPDTWTDEDIKEMKNTLQNCLSLIRFFSLSPKEFSQKVRPYKKLLKRQLYEDLVNSYMDPSSVSTDNISLPRNIKTDEIINSKIVNLNIVSIISRWIDKVDINNKFAHIRELYLPYKFELLLRGSRDGFTTKKFHELCSDKHDTVTFIKVKGTEEIIGGYNPIVWLSSSSWIEGRTSGSFIFSFKSKDNFKDAIISNVKDSDRAIRQYYRHGPFFGWDIVIYHDSDDSKDYNKIFCKKCHYEREIRDTDDEFSMDDYEVFQIVKR